MEDEWFVNTLEDFFNFIGWLDEGGEFSFFNCGALSTKSNTWLKYSGLLLAVNIGPDLVFPFFGKTIIKSISLQ